MRSFATDRVEAGDRTGAFAEIRSLTEQLAAPLTAEDQTVQSMPDASPTKWHRAHTSWFFETFLLRPHHDGYREFHPSYGFLFNSYYEAVGARHPRADRGQLSRPGVEEIAAYRAHVDRAMLDLLGRPLDTPVRALVELGLHHEQQHQELLLMDAKHLLSRNPLLPAYRATGRGSMVATPRAGEWLADDGGLVEIGYRGAGFAFDNETPRHVQYLAAFALSDRLVTNGEWMAFVDDGGYRRPELWLAEGWAVAQAGRWDAPLYWSCESARWEEFTLAGQRPLDVNDPVSHVSYFEADAYAHWAGLRLPTEGEWEAVASSHQVAGAFLDPDVLHPRAAPTEASDPSQLFGTVWQWTSSPYTPYPGYRTAEGAVGEYNGKFMVNQQVLRGGSALTPPGHLRPTYRNFFPASARWACSGLRLARDL